MKMFTMTALMVLMPCALTGQDVTDDLLNQLVELTERSPTLRNALAEVRANPNVSLGFTVDTLPDNEVGRTALLAGGSLRRAVITLDYAQGMRAEMTPDEWAITLVHEVYGHAIPFLLKGELCADPEHGQDFEDSCVGKREAIVLAELGMKARVVYGVRD